jgi:SAM-dependent methyltransferase
LERKAEVVAFGLAELVPDPDRSTAWTLLLDGAPQSHVDLAQPTHLEFEYVRRMAAAIDLLAPAGQPLRVLHLGGGAWTLARYVAATRPRSPQRVVELDGALVELVRTRLPADGLDLDVRVADARADLAAAPAAAWDAVVLDVFAGARTPAHLTSVEFLRAVAGALRPGGVYVANIADGAGASGADTARGRGLAHACGQAATAAAVFTEVAIVAAPEVLHGRRFGNLVLLAADGDGLPLVEVSRRVAADPFPARIEPGPAFACGAPAVTDATATPSPRPPAGFFGQ